MYAFVFTLISFSLLEVASKPLLSQISPFSLTTQRFALGFVVLSLFALAQGQWKAIAALPARRLAALAALGVLNISFSMFMLQLAVQHTNAATAATVFCSNPLFVFFWAWLFRQEAFSRDRLAALILGAFGMMAVTWGKGLSLDRGALFALLAAISFSLYSVLGKKITHGLPAAAANATSYFLAVVVNACALAVMGQPILPPSSLFSRPETLLLWLFLGTIISGMAYITFIHVLQKFKATTASFIFFLKPLLATVFAFGLLDEHPNTGLYAGLLLIGTASLLLIRARHRAFPA